jgi:hypothetical protein
MYMVIATGQMLPPNVTGEVGHRFTVRALHTTPCEGDGPAQPVLPPHVWVSDPCPHLTCLTKNLSTALRGFTLTDEYLAGIDAGRWI